MNALHWLVRGQKTIHIKDRDQDGDDDGLKEPTTEGKGSKWTHLFYSRAIEFPHVFI